MASNTHPKCKCTMAQSLTGDGCRYCQPQEYIDRMLEQIEDEAAPQPDTVTVPRSLVQRWADVDAFNAPKGAAMELKTIAQHMLTEADKHRHDTVAVDERAEFEAWAKHTPREWGLERHGELDSWPGQYADYKTQCAWEPWQARALLDQEKPIES